LVDDWRTEMIGAIDLIININIMIYITDYERYNSNIKNEEMSSKITGIYDYRSFIPQDNYIFVNFILTLYLDVQKKV